MYFIRYNEVHMKKIKVVVLMGGISSEREVSLISGGEVVRNLDKNKYEVFKIDPALELEKIKKIKPDLVFIALHGRYGEDGQIQDLLDSWNFIYTGSRGDACRNGLDKINFNKILEKKGIKVPKTLLIRSKKEVKKVKLIFPVVVKPVIGGSSIGVSIVKESDDLEKAIDEAFKYDSKILIQEYIKGMEITCGVIGNDRPTVLPLVEICPKKVFFDYEAKYNSQFCDEIIPARISVDLEAKIQILSERIYKMIGCRGFARIDYILKDNIPYPLEINIIPGLTSKSLLPKEAEAAGISYPELLDKIIEAALEKYYFSTVILTDGPMVAQIANFLILEG